jgi:hypothetical protein
MDATLRPWRKCGLAGLAAPSGIGGQAVDALPAAARPRAPCPAHLPAGAATGAQLLLAALPLVPRDQLAFDGDNAPKLAMPGQQEFAVVQLG